MPIWDNDYHKSLSLPGTSVTANSIKSKIVKNITDISTLALQLATCLKMLHKIYMYIFMIK